MNAKIGVCDACRARFKIPAEFRADRARCRECGGVVRIGGGAPVPRPAAARRSEPRSDVRADARELPDSPEHEVVPATPRAPTPSPNVQALLPTQPSASPSAQTATRASDQRVEVAARAHRHDAALAGTDEASATTSPKKPRKRRRGLVALVLMCVIVVVAFVAWRMTRPDSAQAATPAASQTPEQR